MDEIEEMRDQLKVFEQDPQSASLAFLGNFVSAVKHMSGVPQCMVIPGTRYIGYSGDMIHNS
jgi:hypothetical protein